MDSVVITFKDIISKLLQDWNTIQFALYYETGGKESKSVAVWLVDAINQFFELNDNLCDEEVADFINEIMNQEMNVLIEDGSDIEIANRLCTFYEMLKNCEYDKIHQAFASLPVCNNIGSYELQNSLEGTASGSQMQDNLCSDMSTLYLNNKDKKKLNASENVEDGWTMVRRKR